MVSHELLCHGDVFWEWTKKQTLRKESLNKSKTLFGLMKGENTKAKAKQVWQLNWKTNYKNYEDCENYDVE